MSHELPYDYDITTMKDGREFIFFHIYKFTKESALQRAREVKEKMGYGDDFIYPAEKHVDTYWIKNNIYFSANPDNEYAYEYSDSTCKEAYPVIGVELIYK